jgi:hypothetical protein
MGISVQFWPERCRYSQDMGTNDLAIVRVRVRVRGVVKDRNPTAVRMRNKINLKFILNVGLD